jgi:hypothetical protein
VRRGFADDVIDIDARMCAVNYTPGDVLMLGYRHAPATDRPEETGGMARDEPDGAPIPNDEQSEGGTEEMEITDVTMEMLREGNRPVYDQIMQAGATQERERLSGLDEIAMAGCEEMVRDAKYGDGKMCGPAELALRMVKDSAGKGAAFMQARREAGAMAKKVEAQGTPDEARMTDEQEATLLGEKIAALA